MDKKNEDALAPDDEMDDLEAVDRLTLSSSSSSSSTEEQMIRLRVQHQLEGSSSLEVSANVQKSTVYTLKERVRTALGPAARGRYLRLIGHGRLLAPDSASLEGFRLMDGDCLHAVLAAPGIRGGQQAALSRGLTPRTRRRRNRDSDHEEEDSDNEDSDVETGRERLGFDRLRATGLTRDEIVAIRLYFSRQVDRYVEQSRTNDTDLVSLLSPHDEDDVEGSSSVPPLAMSSLSREQRLRLEDEWMTAQGPNSEFRLNLNASNPLLLHHRSLFANHNNATTTNNATNASSSAMGTDRDFMWGFILGFFVGFVMLFWVWIPTVPHKQKMGILTGICFQLALSAMQANGANEQLVD